MSENNQKLFMHWSKERSNRTEKQKHMQIVGV